jgi:hypothetical protein
MMMYWQCLQPGRCRLTEASMPAAGVAPAMFAIIFVSCLFVVAAWRILAADVMACMLRAIARGMLIGVPAILDKIYLLATGAVLAAMLRPIPGMTGRHPHIHRLRFNVCCRPRNDDRLRVDHARPRR